MHRGLCYVESKFKKHLFFYLFTFLPLKSTAGNSERSSDGGEEGDCNLQNRFPGICFHHLYYYFLVAMAVRKEIAICKIVFQVFAFIIFIIIFNVKC